MNIDKKMLAVAVGSLLVGGMAVAAFQGIAHQPADEQAPSAFVQARSEGTEGKAGIEVPLLDLVAGPKVGWAPIVSVEPVTRSTPQYATVLGVEPVSRQVAQQQPRQECHDVPVTQRMPERDGNVGGTVAGAVIGGLLGNQVGGGNGRKAATAAGAVAGGFIGNRIDRQHVGGQIVQTTERQCRTVSDTIHNMQVVAYDVTVRNPDGSTAMKRMDKRPGARIALGSKQVTEGYDVTYELAGERHVVRMDERPANDRLRVVDGKVQPRG